MGRNHCISSNSQATIEGHKGVCTIFQRLYSQAYTLLACSALFWGGNAIVGRWLKDYATAVDINLFRWLIAIAILLPIGWRTLAREKTIIWRNLPLIVVLGILGISIFQTILYKAFQTTTAVNAVLLLSTCPIFIVIGNSLVYRERVDLTTVIGIFISLCGAIILISHGNLAIFRELNFYPGDLWMILGSLVWAVYSITLRKRPTELSQMGLLISTVIVGLCVLIPWSIISGEHNSTESWGLEVYAGLLYLGIFASILAFICWNRGVELVGPNKAGIFLHLIPVFTAVLSYLLLNEGVALHHFIGAGLIFSGISLLSKAGKVK